METREFLDHAIKDGFHGKIDMRGKEVDTFRRCFVALSQFITAAKRTKALLESSFSATGLHAYMRSTVTRRATVVDVWRRGGREDVTQTGKKSDHKERGSRQSLHFGVPSSSIKMLDTELRPSCELFCVRSIGRNAQ